MPTARTRKRPRVLALRPATLSSGPESGLVNQLFALMGYAILARRRKAILILPNFTSHDHGGTKCVFLVCYTSK